MRDAEDPKDEGIEKEREGGDKLDEDTKQPRPERRRRKKVKEQALQDKSGEIGKGTVESDAPMEDERENTPIFEHEDDVDDVVREKPSIFSGKDDVVEDPKEKENVEEPKEKENVEEPKEKEGGDDEHVAQGAAE